MHCRKVLPLFFIAVTFGFRLSSVRGDTTPEASTESTLKQMSLDELVNLEVSTVSRKDERWWSAPGAIDVVTSEDIRRSTAMSIPEALRLASGVEAEEPSFRNWGVAIRGFNNIAGNKISIQVDGRSLFTPFFSGVQWNAQDALLEDIDRIEVVRGPVGSIWGAYAVNGFIRILSKPASETQGVFAKVESGTEDPISLAFRYGGKIDRDTHYRAYVKYSQIDSTYNTVGSRVHPSTDFLQSGFRIDAQRSADTNLTLQGDVYTNKGTPRDRPTTLQTELSGGNVLGHFRRVLDFGSELEDTAYVEHTTQYIPSGFSEARDTLSNALKYDFKARGNDILIGTDAMVSKDRIGNASTAQLIPSKSTVHNVSVYAQDTITLVPQQFTVTVGAKIEHASYSQIDFQPTIRASYTPDPQTTIWSAISRAVRTPVRIDEALVIQVGDTRIFTANNSFKPETVTAYEVGFRRQVSSQLTFDVATFYNEYGDIRSFEQQGSDPLPLTFKNTLNARSYGAETTVMYEPVSWLFFKLGHRYLDLQFSKDPGSRDIGNASSEADDPKNMVTLNGHLNFPKGFEMDAFWRYISDLPNPKMTGYRELDLRFGWHPSDAWEVSVNARSLLHNQHREFVTSNSNNELVGRSVTLKLTYRL